MIATLIFLAVIAGIFAVLVIGMVLFEFGIRVTGRIERWFDKYFP